MSDLHRGLTNADILKTALERHPRRVAFRQDGQDITYDAAADRIARIGRVLADRGLTKGAGIAVLSPNRPEAWFTSSASAFLGARYTALHPLGSLEDQTYCCDDAEIHTLVFDAGAFDERAAALAERAATVKQVLALGPSSHAADLLALADEAPATPLVPNGIRQEDISSVLYTGGTTGRPKGVVLTHRSWAQMVFLVFAGWEVPYDVRYLAAAPITHASGMMITHTLLRGGTVVLHRGFDPGAWLRTIAEERITLALAVPTMLYALLDHPSVHTTDLSSLETVVYGASPMSPARMVEALGVFGSVFMQLYGQTESAGTGTALWKRDHDPERPDILTSCGKPMVGIHVRILDDDLAEVPPGEVGEICIRGPAVMEGYWRQPELTEETLRGGWLHTGDMATRDDDGFVTIVDRKKDMIVSGGFNVFPREIEDVLSSHPAVSIAAVIGVPDDKWGEAVKAVVVVKPGATVPADELITLVRERKGPIYTPKSIDFVDSIPLTAVAKPDKKVLRAPYWEGQERRVH